MSFCDFKGIWWVRQTTGMTGECPNHRVAIGGRPDKVTLICINDEDGHKFDTAQYEPESDPDPERIQIRDPTGNPTHAIVFEDDEKTMIICRPCSKPEGPGSWTAEDNAGGDNGYKGK